MQVVILAAGQSTRLRPFSDGRHKSFVSVLGKPLIMHTVVAVKRAGITDIILVTDNETMAKSIVGSGENLGVKISYVVQKEALGMGDALLQAKELLSESFFVTSGYHVDADVLISKLLSKKDSGVSLLLKKRADYWKHGVVIVDENKILSVIEKPTNNEEAEKLCIVGLYQLTKDFVETLGKTDLSHYHLEVALDAYAKKKDISYTLFEDETVSLKYPWDLLDVKDYLLKKIKSGKGENCDIAKSAEIIEDVYIGDNVKIFEGARIKGPIYIGNNVIIGTNAILRNGTVIEDNCVVGAQMEIKNSILMHGTTTHSGFIGDSVIGDNCKIAAQFTTANVRLDRKNVKATIKEEVIDTGKRSLGVFMGSKVMVGINCSVMPGVIVGNNVVIGPSTTVNKNIPSNVKYYTKFQEIVEEKKEFGKKVVLFDIDYTLFDTEKFKNTNLQTFALYEETVDVLSKIKEIAYLGIFSEGNLDLQKTKLLKTKIHSSFTEKHMHIVANKKETIEDILKKYKNYLVFLVDDKLTVLFQAKQLLPTVITIWVKRGMYALNQTPIVGFTPDAIIENLYELVRVVEEKE